MKRPPPPDIATPIVAIAIRLAGRVQGIGLRPAIARLAREFSLAGRVINTSRGVTIHVEGTSQHVRDFERDLLGYFANKDWLEHFERAEADVEGQVDFLFEIDSIADAVLRARVPADVVVCRECLAEIESDIDRRGAYPFTSCASCGPRYTILGKMPYERALTVMNRFAQCPCCELEYTSPENRRFHAQTNTCPICGPRVVCRNAAGHEVSARGDAIAAAAQAIRNGEIVALQGLGGYQLIVDAGSTPAVTRLRERKKRPGKPFAVMVSTLAEAATLADCTALERQALASEAGPIVLVNRKPEARLAAGIAPAMNSIGLMLPTTPLHALLQRACGGPLVVTSGNREGEPLLFSHGAARESLTGIADLWLEHDRPIVRPIDDSVIRIIADRPATIRLARGLAPRPLDLPGNGALLAMGGHQKSAFAICNGSQSILGPHLGDLDTLATRQRFLGQLAEMQRLYGMTANRLIVDRHPDYWTTRWAHEQSLPVLAVQHHHAHVVAGMLEHRWLDRLVLGVAFDGTGFGDDGTIWGGEFLVATSTSYERVGHLRRFRLPGSEQAVREPYRIAVSLVNQAAGSERAGKLRFFECDPQRLLPVLHSPRFSPTTSSVGRLFDGIAALVMGIERVDFEGEAAIRLEAACDVSERMSYHLNIVEGMPIQLDWRPLVREILRDLDAEVPAGKIAMRFHRGLANSIVEFCDRYSSLPVVLGGGVFQNRILVELIVERMQPAGRELGIPGVIPCNDGGLAAGQLAIALSIAP